MKTFFQIIAISSIYIIIIFLIVSLIIEGIERLTGPVAPLNKGRALLEEGQYDRAIAYFNEALEINPRNAEAYNNRGIAFGKERQYDRAIAYFNEALEINPRYADVYENRGFAYYYKGQYDKACSDWRRACELLRDCDWELAKRKAFCK